MKKISIVLSLFLMVIISVSFTNSKIVDDKDRGVIKYVHFDIFGDEYAKTPIVDRALKGQVYYIVSGHGGPDPGAMTKKNGKWLCEDEYAYDVSLRLARNLLSHSAKVYVITRDENDGIRDQMYLPIDKDEVVWGGHKMPLNQVARLRQRSGVINKLYEVNKKKGYKTQRTIVTHVDSRYEAKKVDVFFYYNAASKEGYGLSKKMYSTLKSKYSQHQGGRGYSGQVKSRNLHMLRETKTPTVFIELGNIANEFDQKRLLLHNNRQAIANWLAEGVLNY